VHEGELDPDPLVELRAWLTAARAVSPLAEAMTLATASPDGRPSARIVLLRDVDERGLTFYTNRESRKGEELRENPRAALVLHWWELGRQVRVEGTVEEVGREESEAYWRTRPRPSRIAAWASAQSRPVEDRAALEEAYEGAAGRFEGEEVPLPPHWGGFRVRPVVVELWQHRESRLHDRVRYVRSDAGWRQERLMP
jgi:pyridoxamine 5'-phosphate oxidase